MEFNFPGKKTSHPEGFYEKTQFTPRRSHTKVCLFCSKQGSLFPTEQVLTQTHWPRQANDDTEASSFSWRWTHKQAPGTRSDSNELLNLVKFNLFCICKVRPAKEEPPGQTCAAQPKCPRGLWLLDPRSRPGAGLTQPTQPTGTLQ